MQIFVELEDDWLNSKDAVVAGVTFYVKVTLPVAIDDDEQVLLMRPRALLRF